MRKKKVMQEPVINVKKSKKLLVIGGILVAALVLAGIYGFVSVKEEEPKPEYVQKNVINNYVCKIVGADTDKDMFAVECLTK